MNSGIRALLVLLCGITIGAASRAQTIDLAAYLGLTPGNWAIFQDKNGTFSGYVTSLNANGQIAQTFYRFNGSVWVFDSAELFSITNRRISNLGTSDGATTWLFEPAVSLPRRQQVNDSVVYKGLLRNQSTGVASSVTFSFSLTADGISVTVPAGGFTNCIKVRLSTYGDGGSRDSVSISCPGRSEVKTWYNKIKDLPVPTDENQSDSDALVMVQAGDSNAPFP